MTAMLTDEEMRRAGAYSRTDIARDPVKLMQYIKAAANTSLTWNTLDGGIGESLMREAWLLNKGLRVRLKDILKAVYVADAKYQPALKVLRTAEKSGETANIIAALREIEKLAGFDEPLRFKMGAKGTDLGRFEKVRGSEYFVGDAESRLLGIISLAGLKKFSKVAFQPLVNYQSRQSYENLMKQLYLWDIVEGRENVRTYERALEDAGVDVLELLDQKDLPKFEIEPGQITGLPTLDSANRDKGQPGGHGQWGLYYMIDFTENAPPQDGLHHVRFFGNGDNRKGGPSSAVVGFMIVEKKPILKITTAATAIDKKGGKEILRIVESHGKVFNVLDQWEEIDAKMNKQLDLFYAAGQRKGFGREGKQRFNTNMFLFNIDLLHPILREMREIVGPDEFLDAIMPVLFDKSDKAKGIDGKKYVSMDSAIGYVIHNLNTFYSTDPRLEGLRAKYGAQLLYYMDYGRDIFAPKKGAADQFLQESTDYYSEFAEGIRNFFDAEPGLTPPNFNVTDPILNTKNEKVDSKFWNEAQHWLDSFGFSRVRRMTSFTVEGRVTLQGAEYIGDVQILNRFGQTDRTKPAKRVILSDGAYLDQLRTMGFWAGDHLLLENIQITISENGVLSVLPYQAVHGEGGTVKIYSAESAQAVINDLMARGANISGFPQDMEFKGDGTLLIVPDDFNSSSSMFIGSDFVIENEVLLRMGGKNNIRIDDDVHFPHVPGLTLDLTLKEGHWLHITASAMPDILKMLRANDVEGAFEEYGKQVIRRHLGEACFIRRLAKSLATSPLRDPVLFQNARKLNVKIEEAEASRVFRSELRKWMTVGSMAAEIVREMVQRSDSTERSEVRMPAGSLSATLRTDSSSGEEGTRQGKVIHRILVVEDEASIRRLYEAALGAKGYEIVLSNDGEEAIKLILAAHNAGTPFDLILTDLVMPNMNGVTMIEKLMKMPEVSQRLDSRELPVIFASAHEVVQQTASFEKKILCRALAKPIDLNVLYDLINNMATEVQKNRLKALAVRDISKDLARIEDEELRDQIAQLITLVPGQLKNEFVAARSLEIQCRLGTKFRISLNATKQNNDEFNVEINIWDGTQPGGIQDVGYYQLSMNIGGAETKRFALAEYSHDSSAYGGHEPALLVAPNYQHRNIGSFLVTVGLYLAKKYGHSSFVVREAGPVTFYEKSHFVKSQNNPNELSFDLNQVLPAFPVIGIHEDPKAQFLGFLDKWKDAYSRLRGVREREYGYKHSLQALGSAQAMHAVFQDEVLRNDDEREMVARAIALGKGQYFSDWQSLNQSSKRALIDRLMRKKWNDAVIPAEVVSRWIDIKKLSFEQLEIFDVLWELGQKQLFADWQTPGINDDKKLAFLNQAMSFERSYPGGLENYLANLRAAIIESQKGTASQPEVPGVFNFADLRALQSPQELARKHGNKVAFGLVAGGRGERLGLPWVIKLAIPVSLVSDMPMAEWYARNILELQYQGNSQNGENRRNPLFLMTSADNDAVTRELFEANHYFGMGHSQVTFHPQAAVPTVWYNPSQISKDSDFKIQLNKKDKYELDSNAHGHGDIHMLLYQLDLVNRWIDAGVERVAFLQDTNALTFHALLANLGVSSQKNLAMNLGAVPRRVGEAIGALAKIGNRVMNVEYTLLSEKTYTGPEQATYLENIKASRISAEKKELAQMGMSPFPGNINVFDMDIQAYRELLVRTLGVVPEMIKPKLNAEGTKLAKPVRVESNMQDASVSIGELKLGAIGISAYPKELAFVVGKNDFERAKVARSNGLEPDMVSNQEAALLALHRSWLEAAGMSFKSAESVKGMVRYTRDIPWHEGAKVFFYPSYAIQMNQVSKKVHGGSISDRSVLVIDGRDVMLQDVRIDGALIIKVPEGVKLTLAGLVIENTSWEYRDLTPEEWRLLDKEPRDRTQADLARMKQLGIEDHNIARGFKLVKHDQMTIDLTGYAPGEYVMDGEGEIRAARSEVRIASPAAEVPMMVTIPEAAKLQGTRTSGLAPREIQNEYLVPGPESRLSANVSVAEVPVDLHSLVNVEILILTREFYFGIIPWRVHQGLVKGLRTGVQALERVMVSVGVPMARAEEAAALVVPSEQELREGAALLRELETNSVLKRKLGLQETFLAEAGGVVLATISAQAELPVAQAAVRMLVQMIPKDEAKAQAPVVEFIGEGSASLALLKFLQDALQSKTSELSSLEKAYVRQLVHFNLTGQPISAVLATAVAKRQDFTVSATEKEVAGAASQGLIIALKGQEEFTKLDAAKLKEVARAYAFKTLLLKDLAAKIQAAKLKNPVTDIPALLNAYFQKNLPDIVVNIDPNGRFQLSISNIMHQLSIFETAKKEFDRSA